MKPISISATKVGMRLLRGRDEYKVLTNGFKNEKLGVWKVYVRTQDGNVIAISDNPTEPTFLLEVK